MLSILLALVPLTAFADGEPSDPTRAAVSLARQALGAKLGVGADQIEELEAAPVGWVDGIPSCDAPMESRPGTPANGYRVRLRVAGRVYRVHVGAGRAIVCGGAIELAGSLGPDAIEDGAPAPRPALPLPQGESQKRLVEQARADLSRRLSLDAAGIELVEFQEVMWPDSSLGCPRPGMMYSQVVREGFRILLRSGKRTFAYHSGGGAPFLCEKPRPG